MTTYDLTKFRRDFNLTQKQLAEALNVTQGFLSSVENGYTPFPEERRKDLESQFPDVDLNDYRVQNDDIDDLNDLPIMKMRKRFKHFITRSINDGDITDDSDSKDIDKVQTPDKVHALEAAMDGLKIENESLKTKNDELRDKLHETRNQVFELQNEILRLKSLLLDHQKVDNRNID